MVTHSCSVLLDFSDRTETGALRLYRGWPEKESIFNEHLLIIETMQCAIMKQRITMRELIIHYTLGKYENY